MNAARALSPGIIGVPCLGWIWTESAHALLGLASAGPSGSEIVLMEGPSSIAAKRTLLVRQFLANPAWSWLAMCDSDMAPERDAVL